MKSFLIPILFSVFVGFAQNGAFCITGKLHGDYSGKIYFRCEDLSDSTAVVDGTFSFRGNLKERESEAVFFLEQATYLASVFVEAGDISVDLQGAKSPNADAEHVWNLDLNWVRGSAAHERYLRQRAYYEKYRDKKLSKVEFFDVSERQIERYPESSTSVLALYDLTRDFDESDRKRLQKLYFRLKQKNRLQSLFLCTDIYKRLFPQNVVGIGNPMKHFLLPDQNGRAFDTKTLTGQWILIDFWASWCAGCIEEMAEMKKAEPNPKLRIVTVSIDEHKQSWLNSCQKFRWPWTNLRNDPGKKDQVVPVYGLDKGIPATFLINPEGIIVAKNPAKDELEKWLD